MEIGRYVVPIALVAVGIVWIGQGTGLLPGGSFMVGDPRWAVVGVVLVVVGALLAWRSRRGGRAT